MDHVAYSNLCREVGLLLELESADALANGVWLDSEHVGLLYDEDLDDGLYVYVDVGAVAVHGAQDIYRELLNANHVLSAQAGESFGLAGEPEHIVFRSFIDGARIEARTVAGEIDRCLELVRQMRTGPLAAVGHQRHDAWSDLR